MENSLSDFAEIRCDNRQLQSNEIAAWSVGHTCQFSIFGDVNKNKNSIMIRLSVFKENYKLKCW